MAGPSKRYGRPGRTMLALVALVAVLGGIIAAQVTWADGAQWKPRLGLDLEGRRARTAPAVHGAHPDDRLVHEDDDIRVGADRAHASRFHA